MVVSRKRERILSHASVIKTGEKDTLVKKLTRSLAFALLITVGSVAVIDCGGGVSIGVSQQCEPGERRPASGTCEDPGRESAQICRNDYRWGPPGCYPTDDTATDSSDAGSDAASD